MRLISEINTTYAVEIDPGRVVNYVKEVIERHRDQGISRPCAVASVQVRIKAVLGDDAPPYEMIIDRYFLTNEELRAKYSRTDM
jgi:hypothetical protein